MVPSRPYLRPAGLDRKLILSNELEIFSGVTRTSKGSLNASLTTPFGGWAAQLNDDDGIFVRDVEGNFRKDRWGRRWAVLAVLLGNAGDSCVHGHRFSDFLLASF